MLSANEYKMLLQKYIACAGVPFAWFPQGWQRDELTRLMDELDAFPAGRDTDSALLPVLDRS